MRSRTEPDLSGRCPRCWVLEAWCVCEYIRPTAAQTEIIIVRHPFEAWRASGTARIAELALPRCRIIQPDPPYDRADQALKALGDAWLLFPGGRTIDELGSPPGRLVVLDGTWREVRRMQRRLPALWRLPRLSLPPKPHAPLRLRHTPRDDRRSTLEAIADAITLLEGAHVAGPLSELHRRFVEHSLRARGAWSYRGRT